MLNKIGAMQGRLLPKYQGRYQAHPLGYWKPEFEIARELGLDLIEFILDYDNASQNPLMNRSGIDEIRRISEYTGVGVLTVCADYFMEAPLHHQDPVVSGESCRILKRLIHNCALIGVSDIVIPCVDGSSFENEASMERLTRNIRPVRDLAETAGIRLALETDLPPEIFVQLLATLDSGIFTVNYDTGNSAALGYQPEVEIAAYGSRISDIHLKDRLRSGHSVELGDGDTDFGLFFDSLARLGYTGPLIMQAYRDDEGITVFKKQLEWILPQIKNRFDRIRSL